MFLGFVRIVRCSAGWQADLQNPSLAPVCSWTGEFECPGGLFFSDPETLEPPQRELEQRHCTDCVPAHDVDDPGLTLRLSISGGQHLERPQPHHQRLQQWNYHPGLGFPQ